MHTPTFTGARFGVRLAACAALLLLTLGLAPAVRATPITVIASFNGTNGQQPMGGVTFDAAGNMYGTTYRGAAAHFGEAPGGGVVWEIAHGTKKITDLAQMTGFGSDPGEPYGNVAVDANGTVYATASSGGTTSGTTRGEVFEVVAGSGALTDLGDFAVGANPGWHPVAGVTRDAAGNLFGTTQYGSTNNAGTIWEIPAGGTLTTIASFLGSSPNGSNPVAGVTLDAQGNLYGTTQNGGVDGTRSSGTVWELPHGSDTILTLASFGQQNGSPVGDVTVDAGGNVYGTTNSGGVNRAGLVWEILAGTNTITELASFAGSNLTPTSTNGYNPSGNVVIDGAGNLFGTTTSGGTSAFGTVWEIPAGGTLTTIASFSGVNGDGPYGNVMLDAQGNLFGTASGGGPADAGVVWEMAGVGVPVGVGGGTPVPTALTLTPNPAFPDTTINGTVTFSQSVPAGTPVAITRNGSTSLGSVVTPTAGTSLAFTLPLPGYLNGSYTIGATLNGQTASQTLTVTGDPNKPVPVSLVFSPSPALPGAAITGTVTLSGPAPAGGLSVEIFQNGTDLGTVRVAAGASTALFGQTLTAGTYTYTAVENGVQVATSLTVGTVDTSVAAHVLWTNPDGQASVWNTADANPAATCRLFGPFPGWTATVIAQGPDGNGRILWTNTDGRAALWNLADATPSATAAIYGPFPGWTATALTVGPDNAAHLLWDNTDGRVALWNTTDINPSATCTIAGPYSGWAGVAIGIGSNGQERLLWDNTNGEAAVWNLADANPAATCLLAGPYAGWTAKRLSVGNDSAAHLLWDNLNGEISLWNLSDANPAATCVTAGPYSGWSGQDLSVGADNRGRLLWDNISGQNSLWNLSDANPAATCVTAGPYSGWTAVSVAAGK